MESCSLRTLNIGSPASLPNLMSSTLPLSTESVLGVLFFFECRGWGSVWGKRERETSKVSEREVLRRRIRASEEGTERRGTKRERDREKMKRATSTKIALCSSRCLQFKTRSFLSPFFVLLIDSRDRMGAQHAKGDSDFERKIASGRSVRTDRGGRQRRSSSTIKKRALVALLFQFVLFFSLSPPSFSASFCSSACSQASTRVSSPQFSLTFRANLRELSFDHLEDALLVPLGEAKLVALGLVLGLGGPGGSGLAWRHRE